MSEIIARSAWEGMVLAFDKVICLPEKEEDPKLWKETSATILLEKDYYYDSKDSEFNDLDGLSLLFDYGNLINDGEEQKLIEEEYYNNEFLKSGEVTRAINFLQNNPHSKCCIINLWDKKVHGQMISFCPCIIYVYLRINEGYLDMHTRMRANDAYKVLLMDLHALTAIHAFISSELGLKRGKYIHSVDSLHIYKRNKDDLASFKEKIEVPLYILTEKKLQPRLQKNDLASLNWFKTTANPRCVKILDIYPEYIPIKKETLTKFIPAETFFLNREVSFGIHGIKHISRVLILALLIKKVGEYDHVPMDELAIAAAIHDTQRINDNQDLGHGLRASNWFNRNLSLFQTMANISNKDLINYSVSNHDVKFEEIKESNSLVENDLLKILRTADALDRFRLHKEKWWPEVKMLMCNEGENLIELAKYFVYLSEQNSLVNKQSSSEAVINAALEIGIIV